MTLAERLVGAMKNNKITVESLALESGYSQGYITRLRNGQQTNPSIHTVECLAQVIGVTPEFLAGWSQDT